PLIFMNVRDLLSPITCTKNSAKGRRIKAAESVDVALMFKMTFCISRSLTVAISCFAILVNGSPKFDDGGFVPSSISYMEKQAKAQDQVAMPSSQIKQHDEASKRESETNDIADRSQEARFGFTNVGSTGSRLPMKAKLLKLKKYAAGAENVCVVRTVEATITTCAVACRKDEAATHVVHTLATMSTTTLDARRRRYDTLHPDGRTARQTVTRLARDVALQTSTTAGTRAGADIGAAKSYFFRSFLFLLGAKDAKADVPGACLGEGHVHVSWLGRIHVHIRRREILRADATAARSDVCIVS
ncbi:hypothetical protein ALC62_12879, partial [Cyphomyrmex costatus]